LSARTIEAFKRNW